MPKAAFAIDREPDAGRGHEVRSVTLAKELSKRGWSWELAEYYTGPADVLVIDGRDHADTLQLARGVDYRKVVSITDGPMLICADLIVNGGAGAKLKEDYYANNVLCGPDYAILRPEFRKARLSDEPRKGVFDCRTAAGMGVVEMVQAMRSAKLVVTYGGMRALEAACTGAALIVEEQIDASRGEIENAKALWLAGAAYWWINVPRQIGELNTMNTSKMGRCASELVDGLGCQRVADAIEVLCR